MTDHLTIILRLFFAIFAGGLIGLERTYHGRPAGFRTHALVCTASTLLMLFTVNQWHLIAAIAIPKSAIRVDPTRMAQGIMTGIGFLGAGVIMKEKLTIRGLTTAASIWITASIGIMLGIGFFFPACIASLLTLGVLSLFRWIENVLPSLSYGRLSISLLPKEHLGEKELNDIVNIHNITCSNPSYHLHQNGGLFQYEMTIRTKKKDNFYKLSETLRKMDSVCEFSIKPAGE